MNTMLVWVLVTVGGSHLNEVVYSPYLADLQTCEFLQKNIHSIQYVNSKCIQIKVVK